MIELNAISKSYDGHRVLRDVSLAIPEKAIFGLLGPNGAGKTTLLSILFGLTPMDNGNVAVDGLDLRRNLGRIRDFMGLVPQRLAFYPMLSARENLEFFASAMGIRGIERRRRIDFCVEAAGLGKYLNRRSEYYSGGLKRRLNLAIGLLGNPRVLCLDEPTVGIDPQSRHFILETLRTLNREGMTVVYASHYMEEVEHICTDVAIIDHGRILVNKPLDALLHKGTSRLEIGLEGPLPESLGGLLPEHSLHAGGIRLDETTPAELSALLNRLVEAGANIDFVEFGNRDLESVFLALTQRTLRD